MTTSRISFRIKRKDDTFSALLKPKPSNDVPQVSAIIKTHGFLFYPGTAGKQTETSEEDLIYSMNPSFALNPENTPSPPSPLTAGGPLMTVYESEGAAEEFKRISRIAMNKSVNELPRVIPNKAAAQLGLLDESEKKNSLPHAPTKTESPKICFMSRVCFALIVFMVMIIVVVSGIALELAGRSTAAVSTSANAPTNNPTTSTRSPSLVTPAPSTASPTQSPTQSPSFPPSRPKHTKSPATLATSAPTLVTPSPTAITFTPTNTPSVDEDQDQDE